MIQGANPDNFVLSTQYNEIDDAGAFSALAGLVAALGGSADGDTVAMHRTDYTQTHYEPDYTTQTFS